MDSKEYLESALKIYIANNHHDRYKSYEAMGDLYNEIYRAGGDDLSAKHKSLDNFHRAFIVVEKYFPADSAHIIRIKSKIQNIEK